MYGSVVNAHVQECIDTYVSSIDKYIERNLTYLHINLEQLKLDRMSPMELNLEEIVIKEKLNLEVLNLEELILDES